MISIGLAYTVTLSLYPGIVSEIISCKLGSWMPIILMTTFNASDLLGKVSIDSIACALHPETQEQTTRPA